MRIPVRCIVLAFATFGAHGQSAAQSSQGQATGHSFLASAEGSTVTFKIKNFGFNTDGSFKGLQGVIVWDAQNPARDSFDVSIDAASVNTDNDTRDDHLKKDTYFDVEKFPRIRFVSSAVAVADKNGHYTMTGKLTIKGVTKEISFPFLAAAAGEDFIFKGSFTILRRDFGVGGTSTLSNEVTVTLTVLARKA
jgi:polyisoprenoid-binding protein YceI